ncbi:phytoene/squalene synthase family protein [Dactylosporangium sp. CA-139066]|uniref:phytoene/squalene synthase family protein n=1 Tax=Dactylosporangium sp. CA-139066 TaxID=3239930 RepID=UPI003D92417A
MTRTTAASERHNTDETDRVADAYRRCEELTRREARNFFYGIRLLPVPKRRAMSAAYALARRIDDIGDDGLLTPMVKADRLEALRRDLHGPPGRLSDDPVILAVRDAASRRPIPLSAFDEIIDGCQADAAGRRYEDFDDLLWYCRSVAGSVGRISVGVFGSRDQRRAAAYGDALGVALQLTNILRDLAEDAGLGRRYLPAGDLRRFGCELRWEDGRFTDAPDRLAALVQFEASRADTWYGNGLRLLPLLDRRSAACVATMAGIYRDLLRRIARNPMAVTAGRISLPTARKAWIAGRSLTRATA